MFSHFVASPCLIVLAHNEAKIVSLVLRLPLARLPLKCSFGNPKRKAPKTNYPQNNIINTQTGAAVFQPLPSLYSLCFRHFRAIAAIPPSVQLNAPL